MGKMRHTETKKNQNRNCNISLVEAMTRIKKKDMTRDLTETERTFLEKIRKAEERARTSNFVLGD